MNRRTFLRSTAAAGVLSTFNFHVLGQDKTGKKYRTALKGQFTQGSNVQLQVRNEKGNSVLDFKSVPIEEVGTLILALMDHVPPSGGLRGAE